MTLAVNYANMRNPNRILNIHKYKVLQMVTNKQYWISKQFCKNKKGKVTNPLKTTCGIRSMKT